VCAEIGPRARPIFSRRIIAGTLFLLLSRLIAIRWMNAREEKPRVFAFAMRFDAINNR
jgi:hypothetical protein